jgi:hypothetical protein
MDERGEHAQLQLIPGRRWDREALDQHLDEQRQVGDGGGRGYDDDRASVAGAGTTEPQEALGVPNDGEPDNGRSDREQDHARLAGLQIAKFGIQLPPVIYAMSDSNATGCPGAPQEDRSPPLLWVLVKALVSVIVVDDSNTSEEREAHDVLISRMVKLVELKSDTDGGGCDVSCGWVNEMWLSNEMWLGKWFRPHAESRRGEFLFTGPSFPFLCLVSCYSAYFSGPRQDTFGLWLRILKGKPRGQAAVYKADELHLTYSNRYQTIIIMNCISIDWYINNANYEKPHWTPPRRVAVQSILKELTRLLINY